MTFTLDEELLVELKNISNKTMIPQARIVQTAIKEYLKKDVFIIDIFVFQEYLQRFPIVEEEILK